MKKHVKLFTALFTAVMLFAGCSGGAKQNPPAKDTEPKAVTNLKAKAGDGKVTLSWTNPTYDGFEGINVFFKENSASEWPSTAVNSTLLKNIAKYTVENLVNDSTYNFKVVASFGTDEENNPIIKEAVVNATPKLNVIPTTSVEFAKDMEIGWNLGNALDASSCGDWAYNEGLKMEYSWLPHKQATSRELIKAVRTAGFKTIRIPISWHNHMDKTDSNYKIKDYWMNRVKEIVDWAIEEDMYVIINIHHDNLTEDEIKSNPGFCLSKDTSIQNTSISYIEKVWAQIAETFKNYDYHLVFEVLNEPRCVGSDFEWGFWGDNAGKEKDYCKIITKYEQAGLDVIRNSGGNNAERFVMVPGYAANPSYSLPENYTMPTDSTANKLILATHAYTPTGFALNGDKTDYNKNKSYIESSINGVFDDLKKYYTTKGTGVVMGEASASDKENTASREKWATYYFKKAKETGIPVVLWDNEVVVAELDAEAKGKYDGGENGENHGYFNRQTCKQYFPTLIEAMMKAVYGEDYTPGESGSDSGDPEDPTDTTETVIFDASTLTTAPSVSNGSTELVELGGIKYLKVTPDGWGTNFELNSAISISGKTQIVATLRTEEDMTGYQAAIQCLDNNTCIFGTDENGNNKSVSMNSCSATPKEYSETIVTGSSISKIVVAVMETTGWSAVNTVPIYISKIIAK